MKHSNDAVYHRISDGAAYSFDERASQPLLIVNDRTGRTLASFDAQQLQRLFELLKERLECGEENEEKKEDTDESATVNR